MHIFKCWKRSQTPWLILVFVHVSFDAGLLNPRSSELVRLTPNPFGTTSCCGSRHDYSALFKLSSSLTCLFKSMLIIIILKQPSSVYIHITPSYFVGFNPKECKTICCPTENKNSQNTTRTLRSTWLEYDCMSVLTWNKKNNCLGKEKASKLGHRHLCTGVENPIGREARWIRSTGSAKSAEVDLLCTLFWINWFPLTRFGDSWPEWYFVRHTNCR